MNDDIISTPASGVSLTTRISRRLRNYTVVTGIKRTPRLLRFYQKYVPFRSVRHQWRYSEGIPEPPLNAGGQQFFLLSHSTSLPCTPCHKKEFLFSKFVHLVAVLTSRRSQKNATTRHAKNSIVHGTAIYILTETSARRGAIISASLLHA